MNKSILTTRQYEYEFPWKAQCDVKLASLRDTVEFLTSIRPPRNYRHPQSLNAAAAYMCEQLSRVGLSTDMQWFDVEETVYGNVIGRCGAKDTGRVIVGAHYDVCGDQPGADDNASALAGLLEIARLVKMYADDSPYSFEFVAYSLEEPPFFATEHMGSYHHAQSLYTQGIPVHAMICLEMIGYYSTAHNSQKYPLGILNALYPSVGDFIAVVGNIQSRQIVNNLTTHFRQTSLKAERLIAPALVPGIDFSDNRNFWEFGYPE